MFRRHLAAPTGLASLCLIFIISAAQAGPPQQAAQTLAGPQRQPGLALPGDVPGGNAGGYPTPGSTLNASAIFVEAPTYGTAGVDALWSVSADLNNDGKLDLVVANECATSACANGSVGVLLGNGDGTFQPAITYSSGGYDAYSVVVADVNGDGRPDLLVTNLCSSSTVCTNGTVGVLLGNGDGTFLAAAAYASGGENAVSSAVADVNGDGKPDLLVANQCVINNCSAGGVVGVLLGNGNGTFQAAVSYGTGGQDASGVAVADLNGDSKPDLIVANYCAGSVCGTGGAIAVLLGNGGGTFQAAVSYGSGGFDTLGLAVGDVNSDGRPDVVVANGCVMSDCSTGGGAGVLLSNGDGTLQTAVSHGSGGVDPRAVALVDVNHDSRLDILVANQCANNSNCSNSGGVGILLGNGTGTFQTAVSYGSGGRYAYSVAAGDFNGDGKTDLLVDNECAASTSCSVGALGILLGNGNGTFQGTSNYGSGGANAYSMVTADVNNDGKLDLLVANYCIAGSCSTGGAIGVLLGNGDGTFQPALSYNSGGIDTESIAVSDVNGDGKPDIVVANYCASSSSCSNGTVSVLLGNGDGTFQTAMNYSSGGYESVSVALADVNGDHKLDVVVANFCATSSTCTNGGQVNVLLGNGNGTFQNAVSYAAGGYGSESLAVADVNGDGKLDVIVANNCASGTNCANGTATVLLGNGDGTFRTAVGYGSGGYGAFAVTAADVNADGKQDLLITNNCVSSSSCTNGILGVLLGKGDGTFQTVMTTQTPSIGWGALATADFNGDGKLDVASGGGDFLMLGNGNGTFQSYVYLGAGGQGIAAADFNRDGSPDFAVGGVTVALNRTPRILASATTVTSSLNPSNYGTSVTFTATVTASGGGTPTGTITFQDGTSTLATVTMVNGAASYTTSALTVGTHSINAAYSGDSNFQASSGAISQVVNVATSTTMVASSLNPSSYGQTVQFTASVTGSGSGTPTGTVTFYDGSSNLGSVSLQNGSGTISISTLVGGTHSITAAYGGDTNFSGSTSSPLSQVVNQSSSTTSVTSSLNPSTYGQTVTFTASVAGSASGTPTGTVKFLDGTTKLGTVTLQNGSASFSISTLTGGSHSITVTYNGDSNFLGSTSPTLSQTVNTASSTTKLTSSLNPSTYGQAVTLTATVTSSASGTPTGIVTFNDGASSLGSASLQSGTASITVTTFGAATHSITAAYGGDTNFQTSNSAVLSETVNLAATTATVTSSADPAAKSQSVTYTASVSNTYGGALTGTVTFKDGSTTLGTFNVGQASFTTSYSKNGTHTITAVYSGDANNKGSTSAVWNEYIETLPVATTTTMATSGSPSTINQLVTFTASVTSQYGSIPNGETVTFYDGTTQIATGTTSGGVATFSTSALSVATHTIKGTYAGDANFKTSTGSVQQIVNPYTTSTNLTVSPTTLAYGQSVLLTAVVSTAGTTTPTGKVTFYNGATSLGSGTLSATGTATLNTAKLTVGTDSITATYGGDSLNGKSTSSAVTATVSQAQITLTLTSSPNPSTSGNSVKFTATVTSTGGVPNGQTVTFTYNGSTLGTGTLSSGKASYSTTTLPVGSDVVTATYAGSTDYSSASASVTQTVN